MDVCAVVVPAVDCVAVSVSAVEEIVVGEACVDCVNVTVWDVDNIEVGEGRVDCVAVAVSTVDDIGVEMAIPNLRVNHSVLGVFVGVTDYGVFGVFI